MMKITPAEERLSKAIENYHQKMKEYLAASTVAEISHTQKHLDDAAVELFNARKHLLETLCSV